MKFRFAALALVLWAGLAAAADKTSPALPPLPKAVASHGAVACDGYVYVYGGHAGKTHSYDTESVLGTFHRLKLDGGTKWEELPGGPIAQGMNLAAHGGKVYRVGGMQPRNKPGDPADNFSLVDCARFDPKVGKWEELPPLPAGRSSHDVVVVGDKLVVVGGWQMKGKGEKAGWHETVEILDLGSPSPKWQSVPQPFKRRALTATAVGSKVYVLGGLGADGKAIEIFDVETGKWATGPALPDVAAEGAARAMAFSPAAGTVNGRVVVTTAAGSVYRLTADGSAWEKVGAAANPRVVARLIPVGPAEVLLIGGASRSASGNVAEVERLTLAEKGEPVAAPAPKKD
jgi:N-acetylneuraminic acid mutarotase